MRDTIKQVKITLEDVLDIMMEHGIVAGLQLERIRVKSLIKVVEHTAYEQGWMDSRF
jgi:hypothetical protein|tara:strand:- start:370 stop:540 length:171 start_codon:yes stop_codon:yes gene_type:complete